MCYCVQYRSSEIELGHFYGHVNINVLMKSHRNLWCHVQVWWHMCRPIVTRRHIGDGKAWLDKPARQDIFKQFSILKIAALRHIRLSKIINLKSSTHC